MNFRNYLQRVLMLLVITALSVVLIAYIVFRNLGDSASNLVESRTGMKCTIASVHPRFPTGIKASGITIYSMTGEPLLQAKEISAKVNIFNYLLNGRKLSSLFNNLEGDQIKLALTRNADGEWNLPQTFTSQKKRSSAEDVKVAGCRISFTNLTISIKTGKGDASRFYKGMEADFNPAGNYLSLKLSGTDESAQISFENGTDKKYELQAENFSMALLAPALASPFPLENLIINGKMRATSNDNKKFIVDGNGNFKISNFRHATLSSKTIDDINLPFELNCDLTSSGIEKLNGKINMAGEIAAITGNVEGLKKPVINLSINFSDFSFNKAISALPASLHPTLPDIRLSGSMTGTFGIYLDTDNPDSLNYNYSGHIDPIRILNLGQGINIDALKSPFRHNVRTKRGKGTSIMLSPGNPDFIPYHSIPTSLIRAVMTAEDGSFFSHKGFSKKHIRDSLIENMKADRVVRGGSTISMQLAKNLYLSPERTLSRKLEEALITVALEQGLKKERIMEIYLNIIEWGNGIYGIGQASEHYFSKRPEELKPVESAFLASIIARPTSNWRPDPLSKLSQGWWEYLQVILCKMYEMREAEAEDLLEAGVSEARIAGLRQTNARRL